MKDRSIVVAAVFAVLAMVFLDGCGGPRKAVTADEAQAAADEARRKADEAAAPVNQACPIITINANTQRTGVK